jgi:copper resistance protein B
MTDLVPGAQTPGAAEAAAREAVAPDEARSGGPKLHYALLDRFEWTPAGDAYGWDFSALAGGGTDRLYFGSSGDGAFAGRLEYLELDLFYSRNIGGGWDLNAGFRTDILPDEPFPRRAWRSI